MATQTSRQSPSDIGNRNIYSAVLFAEQLQNQEEIMPLPEDPIPGRGFRPPAGMSPVTLGIVALLGLMALLYAMRHYTAGPLDTATTTTTTVPLTTPTTPPVTTP